MKKLLLVFALSGLCALPAYANNAAMMKYYNNPQAAPKVPKCKGNTYCNAFVALAKQWKSIPNNYRYKQFNIKEYAAKGDGYGLHKGFSIGQTDTGYKLHEAGEIFFYSANASKADTRIFAQGLAVILYLEDTNGLIPKSSY